MSKPTTAITFVRSYHMAYEIRFLSCIITTTYKVTRH